MSAPKTSYRKATGIHISSEARAAESRSKVPLPLSPAAILYETWPDTLDCQ